MLFESDVINFVCDYLEKNDYQILQRLYGYQKGVDIKAEKSSRLILIEAKGETSEDKRTKRYGKEFSNSQVHKHVSVALYKCSEMLTSFENDSNFIVAMALPFNKNHINALNKISKVISTLEIVVFWVKPNGDVKVEGPF